jgi:hypothetical protein
VLRRVAAAVVLVGLCAPASAPAARGGVLAARGAVRLVAPRGQRLPARWQAWAAASLVPTVRGRVTVRLTGCPHVPRAAGCVYTKQPRVIYLAPRLASARGVLLHELGHVFDLAVLNDRDRARFRTIMQRPAWQWWTGTTPLAEWFAEGYSWCARYAPTAVAASDALYRYRPTTTQYHRVCALIRSAAAHNRTPAPAQAPPVITGDPAPPAPPPADEPEATPAPVATDSPITPIPPIRIPTPTASPHTVPPLPTPTRSPHPTPTPSATPTPTASPTPTPEPTPTATPEPTPTATPEPTPSPTASPTPTATPEATPTPEPTATATPEPTPTTTTEPTPTATPEPGPTATPEPTPTATPEPGPTATPEPTPTATPEPTPTPTPTPSPSPTPEPTAEPTATATATATAEPTATVEPTASPEPTSEASPSPTPTVAPGGGATPTAERAVVFPAMDAVAGLLGAGRVASWPAWTGR